SLGHQKSPFRASLPPASLWDALLPGTKQDAVPGDDQSLCSADASDEWLGNQQPPISPIFSDIRDTGNEKTHTTLPPPPAPTFGIAGPSAVVTPPDSLHSLSSDDDSAAAPPMPQPEVCADSATTPTRGGRRVGAEQQRARSFQVDVYSLVGRQPLVGGMEDPCNGQVGVREMVWVQGQCPRLVAVDGRDPGVAAALRRYPL
ncbi:hypothetical protein GQ54DRAFT_314449, partial [Martensiomyces pterosporus]